MLNENQKFEKKEATVYTVLKNDIYQVVLTDVRAEEHNKFQSEEMETVLSFEFAVLAGKDAEGQDARTRLLAKNFVPSYLYISSKKGKNWLYKIVEALIGRELTKEEEANGITGKTLNHLVGKQCRVLLEKTASKKDPTKFYSSIANILTADTEIPGLTAEEMAKIAEYKAGKKDDSQPAQVGYIPGDERQDYIPRDEEMVDEIKVEDIPF